MIRGISGGIEKGDKEDRLFDCICCYRLKNSEEGRVIFMGILGKY